MAHAPPNEKSRLLWAITNAVPTAATMVIADCKIRL